MKRLFKGEAYRPTGYGISCFNPNPATVQLNRNLYNPTLIAESNADTKNAMPHVGQVFYRPITSRNSQNKQFGT
ncbi:MAG: hypothetical protein LBJ00_11100 [Planctomycetaceae bacterium]|nr:hypothetical protein [Planctomycetaceae bacterium]